METLFKPYSSFGSEFAGALNSTFKLPYKTLMQVRFIFTKDLHIPPSEFDNMEFFEILLMLEEYKEWVEEENKRNGEQNEKYNAEMDRVKSGMPDYNRMSQNLMPNMGNMSMPSMNMPSFNMPSFPS